MVGPVGFEPKHGGIQGQPRGVNPLILRRISEINSPAPPSFFPEFFPGAGFITGQYAGDQSRSDLAEPQRNHNPQVRGSSP